MHFSAAQIIERWIDDANTVSSNLSKTTLRSLLTALYLVRIYRGNLAVSRSTIPIMEYSEEVRQYTRRYPPHISPTMEFYSKLPS